MRLTLLAASSLIVLSFATAVFAKSSDDATYDKHNSPVGDSNGKCVRTMWQEQSDPCAIPEPKAVARPIARVAAPVIAREQRTMYFEFNKTSLTTESSQKLDQLAKIVNESSAITDVTIHGFTDQIGTDSYNAALATKRVEAVKAYLDSKSRIKAEGDIKGMGKSSPEASCQTVKKRADKITCMAKERRVEVEFNAQK
jgi:OOP family OmpA-OmpF porin